MTLTADMPSRFVLAAPPPGFAADPYPHLAALREHAPLCAQPDGSWIVSRYDDVREVLTDAERFSSDKQVDFRPKFGDSPLYEHHTMSLVFNDAPYHTRVRKLLAPFFAAQTLRRLQDRVAQMVDELLDRAADRGTLDIVGEFAIAVPLNLVGDLLGVPREEREPLREWANLILGGLDPQRTPEQLAAGNRAVEDFKAYLRELIRWKRAHPAQAQDTDILWALIQSHDAGSGLSELEIIHNSIFMLNAGHDTTASLIANGIDLLLRHPDQCARLAADPTLMRTAIEEMLRAESPLQFGNRRSRVPLTLAGEQLPAGTFLHVAIAAANRDPRVFADPDRFDVGRDPNRHLAFGHGAHFCAGNAVARMEANIAFTQLLARFPGLVRAGPTVRAERTRFRVIERLPVRLC
ncbi:MAG: cytochrome P450 [Burkholderiaceae bacterium]|nr:cytochrome P450 [Burkholderiaceae bacterium]MBP6817221.1 cytochrome P450 [Burkholderiaceae bacterium]